MLKKYIITTIFVVFLTSLPTAGEILDYYSCPSIESGKACSRKCEKIGGISFDVRQNPKRGNVNVTLFTQNEVAPETLKNCDVQNAKNWFVKPWRFFRRSLTLWQKGCILVRRFSNVGW